MMNATYWLFIYTITKNRPQWNRLFRPSYPDISNSKAQKIYTTFIDYLITHGGLQTYKKSTKNE